MVETNSLALLVFVGAKVPEMILDAWIAVDVETVVGVNSRAMLTAKESRSTP